MFCRVLCIRSLSKASAGMEQGKTEQAFLCWGKEDTSWVRVVPTTLRNIWTGSCPFGFHLQGPLLSANHRTHMFLLPLGSAHCPGCCPTQKFKHRNFPIHLCWKVGGLDICFYFWGITTVGHFLGPLPLCPQGRKEGGSQPWSGRLFTARAGWLFPSPTPPPPSPGMARPGSGASGPLIYPLLGLRPRTGENERPQQTVVCKRS